VRRHRRHKGLLGPLLLAVGLAAAGHSLSSSQPVVRPVATPAAEFVAMPVLSVRGSTLSQRLADEVAIAPRPAPTRATRSTPRITRPAADVWVRPAYGIFTSPFGPRWGRMHLGIDIAAAYGSPIYAAANGVVTSVGFSGGYGRLLTIRHAGGVVSAYGHMSAFAVSVGERVTAGQVVAYMGATGDATGVHLHFEIRPGGGAQIDPLPFLRRHGVYI
jgi:murein DD-endopeptidase MepM/ murein hydrolase activator NlpD